MKKNFIITILALFCFCVNVSAQTTIEQESRQEAALRKLVAEFDKMDPAIRKLVGNNDQMIKDITALKGRGAGLSSQGVRNILTGTKDKSTSLKLLRDDVEKADAGATVRMFTTEVALLDAAGYTKEERIIFDGLDPVKDAVARRVFLAKAYQRLVRNMALEMLTNPDADGNKNVSALFVQRVGEIAPKPEKQDLSGYAKTSDIPKPVDLTGYAKTTDIPKPVDLSGYAKISDIPKPVDLAGYAKTSDLNGYASQEAMDQTQAALGQTIEAVTCLTKGGHFGTDKEGAREHIKEARRLAEMAKAMGLE